MHVDLLHVDRTGGTCQTLREHRGPVSIGGKTFRPGELGEKRRLLLERQHGNLIGAEWRNHQNLILRIASWNRLRGAADDDLPFRGARRVEYGEVSLRVEIEQHHIRRL